MVIGMQRWFSSTTCSCGRLTPDINAVFDNADHAAIAIERRGGIADSQRHGLARVINLIIGHVYSTPFLTISIVLWVYFHARMEHPAYVFPLPFNTI